MYQDTCLTFDGLTLVNYQMDLKRYGVFFQWHQHLQISQKVESQIHLTQHIMQPAYLTGVVGKLIKMATGNF